MISFARIHSIALKEFRHILRDPFTMGMSLGLPVALVLIFGFVIDLNYGDLHMMLRDRDNTRISREFARSFSSSGYFTLTSQDASIPPAQALSKGEASAVLEIKKDFALG